MQGDESAPTVTYKVSQNLWFRQEHITKPYLFKLGNCKAVAFLPHSRVLASPQLASWPTKWYDYDYAVSIYVFPLLKSVQKLAD